MVRSHHWFECDAGDCTAVSPAMRHPLEAVAAAKAMGWEFLAVWHGHRDTLTRHFCPKCISTPDYLHALDDTGEIRKAKPGRVCDPSGSLEPHSPPSGPTP